MFCPICHPNHLYVEACIPTTRFQIDETHGAMVPDVKFPSLTTFDQAQLKLAQHLSTIFPNECRHSFEACRIAALKAYDGFVKLTGLHSLRYMAMCPQDEGADDADEIDSRAHADAGADNQYEPGQPDQSGLPPVRAPFTAFSLHCASTDHLLNWPALRHQGVLTVTYPPKIPPEILSFTVDQSAYEAYVYKF